MVGDGATVVIETISHEGILPDQGRDPVGFFGALGIDAPDVLRDAIEIAGSDIARDEDLDGPHVVTGPVAVAGARPGDVLRVEFVALERRTSYGIISNRHGRGVLAGKMPQEGSEGAVPSVVSHLATVSPDGTTGYLRSHNGASVSFPLNPFLGLVGVAPATPEELSSRPPGAHGGNLDIRHLGTGTSLLLPVRSQGALLYVGDPHFAQGNGEVALTAFEAPLRATLKLTLEHSEQARRFSELMDNPWGETGQSLIAIGLGEDLDSALRQAVTEALAMVMSVSGLDEAVALSYLSAAADFEVSQAVNGVRGVHCVVRKTDLSVAPT